MVVCCPALGWGVGGGCLWDDQPFGLFDSVVSVVLSACVTCGPLPGSGLGGRVVEKRQMENFTVWEMFSEVTSFPSSC